MYKLYVFPTNNSNKTVYVAEALKVPFELKFLDLSKGEQKTEAFLAINPMGKAPALEHEGRPLFESGAICRYMANNEQSPLYPADPYQRALVDQWLDFFTIHLGRWLNTLFYEQFIKKQYPALGQPNQASIDEATKFAQQQMQVIDKHLSQNTYFTGEHLSIADFFGFAYVENTEKLDFPLTPYPHVSQWYQRIGASDAVACTHQKMVMPKTP